MKSQLKVYFKKKEILSSSLHKGQPPSTNVPMYCAF